MSSAFATRFAESGFPMLLEEHGEPVIYHKKLGGSRPIQMIIDRNPPAQFDAAGNVITPVLQGRGMADATNGISITELNASGDQIEVPVKIGLAAQKLTITKVVELEAGVLTVDLK